MANNYRLFSERVTDLSWEEEQWFKDLFSLSFDIPEEDRSTLVKMAKMLKLPVDPEQDIWDEIGKHVDTYMTWPGFSFHFEDHFDERCMWVYAVEHGDVEALALEEVYNSEVSTQSSSYEVWESRETESTTS